MEKLLVFHLAGAALSKLEHAAGALKIKLVTVEPQDYRQTLGDLAARQKNPFTEPFTGEPPEESLLLFCDFDDKKMDRFLLTLRRQQILTDYKAVLTPTNKSWNVLRLLLELRAEKAAFAKQQP